jgi:hypothetical protein
MNDRVKKTLNIILDKFKSGDIPEAVAYTMYPFPDTPSSKWSLLNRTLVFLNGTMDARGIRQWNAVKRFVNKGSKALYILVPYLKKTEDSGVEQYVLAGFMLKPVFAVEQTHGEPLEYENLDVPPLPLMDRAQEWGISIKAIPGNFQYYGFYSPDRKEIAMATSHECVFFHELAHCAHHIIKGKLRPGQNPLQEIVAELAAQTLGKIVGKSAEDTTGNSFRYIEKYAAQLKMDVHTACMKVMSDTEKVLNLILKTETEEKGNLIQLVA